MPPPFHIIDRSIYVVNEQHLSRKLWPPQECVEIINIAAMYQDDNDDDLGNIHGSHST